MYKRMWTCICRCLRICRYADAHTSSCASAYTHKPHSPRCRSPHVNAPAAGQGPVGQRQQPLATPATERQASLRAVPETLAVRDERSTPAARPERDAVSVKATPGLERISLWSVCCAAGEDVELELQREGLDEEAQGRRPGSMGGGGGAGAACNPRSWLAPIVVHELPPLA